MADAAMILYDFSTLKKNNVVKVVRAQHQVVSGLMYILKLSVQPPNATEPHCVNANIGLKPWVNTMSFHVEKC